MFLIKDLQRLYLDVSHASREYQSGIESHDPSDFVPFGVVVSIDNVHRFDYIVVPIIRIVQS